VLPSVLKRGEVGRRRLENGEFEASRVGPISKRKKEKKGKKERALLLGG
jgi:hypothetical protein